MIEREANVFDNKLNLHPVDVENINSVINLPFEALELTAHCKEVKDERLMRYAKKRKIRRVKASGIF
jgi:hypothetical protein